MKYSIEDINLKLVNCGKGHIVATSEVDRTTDKCSFYCTKHKIHYTQRLCDALRKKYGCPECVREGKTNTLLSKHNLVIDFPDVAKLLLDPSQASKIPTYTKRKYWFVCPDCGTKLYKSVFNVVMNGLKCEYCSDGFSYPNKLMFNVLKQLDIEFISEFNPEWINRLRYDFEFIINGICYIVEMDGGLGHGKKTFANKENPIITKQRDDYKDELAKENNYQVIRIECDKSEMEYIRNNIYNSELSNILNLSKVDWKECDKNARTSLLKTVCEYYEGTKCSIAELCEKFILHKETIKRYLRTGYSIGLNSKYKRHSNSTKVLCVESQIIFDSVSDAANYYGIDTSGISKVCSGKRHSVGKLSFKYLDDCTEIEIRNLNPNYNIKAVSIKHKPIPIKIYDIVDNKEYLFNSICEAARYLGKDDWSIGNAVNREKPYLDRYKITA